MAYETIPIFQPIFEKIDTTLINVLGSKASAIIGLVSPIVVICFAIYVMLVLMSYQKDNASWSGSAIDMIKRIAAWGVIISCSMNVSFYMGTVVPMINGIPVELSNLLTSESSSGNVNNVDSIISYYITVIQEMWAKASGIQASIAAAFNILLLIILGIPVVVMMAAYLLLAKLFLAILIAIGPLFLCLALFPVTRQYATLWIGQVVNFMLLGVLMNVTAVVMINILLGLQVDPLTASLVDILAYGVIALLFFIVILRIPDLASALSGGVAANGFGSAVQSANQATQLGKAIAKGLGGGGKGGGGQNTMKSEAKGK